MTTTADPLTELISGYFEANLSTIEELLDHETSKYDPCARYWPGPLPGPGSEPSPLEFMRFVASNKPFVARGAASSWMAVRTWSASFLRDVLINDRVNIAVTPKGNADAPAVGPDGNLVFAKPFEEEQLFPEFLDYLSRQELGMLEGDDVRYAQTQNDNLRHEYAVLSSHVQKEIPFARIALQRPPEAINLWIGNSKSVTAMHRDNFENIYVQIIGQKHFVLLPPLCQPCVNEKILPPYTYRRHDGKDGGRASTSTSTSSLHLVADDNPPYNQGVPFAIWDPDQPKRNATDYSALAKPMRVTLNPGDMLYLPAMWYHKVSQSCDGDGICVAVNYWYDMEYTGSFYPLTEFVRSVYRAR